MVSQYFFCPSGCCTSLSNVLQLHLSPLRELLCPSSNFVHYLLRFAPIIHSLQYHSVHPLPIILRAGATHCDCGRVCSSTCSYFTQSYYTPPLHRSATANTKGSALWPPMVLSIAFCFQCFLKLAVLQTKCFLE